MATPEIGDTKVNTPQSYWRCSDGVGDEPENEAEASNDNPLQAMAKATAIDVESLAALSNRALRRKNKGCWLRLARTRAVPGA